MVRRTVRNGKKLISGAAINTTQKNLRPNSSSFGFAYNSKFSL